MDVRERLGMLAAGNGPRNRPGRQGLTAEDLMTALGWIGKAHVTDMLLARYAGHEQIPDLVRMMMARWAHNGCRYKLDEDQMKDLCELAIQEHFDPRTCDHCKGTGVTIKTSKSGGILPVVCPSCWGTGRYRYSIRRKAGAVRIDKNTWGNRKLETLYRRMLNSLSSWETYGCRRIHRVLIDEPCE